MIGAISASSQSSSSYARPTFDPMTLVPQPQEFKILYKWGDLEIAKFIAFKVPNEYFHKYFVYFKERFKTHGIKLVPDGESCKMVLHIEIDPTISEKEQSYKLQIHPKHIYLTAHDEAGMFYGINTILQIIEACPKPCSEIWLPELEIRDWPDFPVRGVLLDISRDRVPTLEALMELVDKFASWKINQLQLYMEHTYAYEGHETVWKGASPLTKDEVKILDAYCKARLIELVPNQNTLAHMHRWVMHHEYKRFAECPSAIHKKEIEKENYEHEGNPGYSLCPTDPAAQHLISGLLSQLLPNFSSTQVNVGLDEPNDLSKGGERSKDLILQKGCSKIYMNYLQAVYKLIKSHGDDRIMQFWADFILLDEEAINQLPPDVIPLVWGYEQGFPFHLGKKFTERDIKWYVCPSTCTWSSLGGRTLDGLQNLTQAAIKGKESHASGFLMTEWGDNGHHNPLSVAYLGFLVGAAVSWHTPQDELQTLNVRELLNVHAFKDSAKCMGQIAYQLGELYREVITDRNLLTGCSALLRLLVFNDNYPDRDVIESLSLPGLNQAQATLKKMKEQLSTTQMKAKDAGIIISEYQLVIELLDFSSQLGIVLLTYPKVKEISKLPKAERVLLKGQLKILITNYSTAWLLRNREGGLKDSVRRLKHLMKLLA